MCDAADDDHDAAQVLMLFGKQPYAEKDLKAALSGSDEAAAGTAATTASTAGV